MKGRLFLGLCVLSIMGFLFFTSHPIKRSEESAIGVAYPRTAKNRIEQMFQSGEIQSRSVNLFLQYIRYGDPGKRNGNSQLFNELKGKVKEALGGRRGRIRRNDLLEKLGEDPRNYPGRNIWLVRKNVYFPIKDLPKGFFPDDHARRTSNEEDLISSNMLQTSYQDKTEEQKRDYNLRKQVLLESLGGSTDVAPLLPLDVFYEMLDIIQGKKRKVRSGKLDDKRGIMTTIVPPDSQRKLHLVKDHYNSNNVIRRSFLVEPGEQGLIDIFPLYLNIHITEFIIVARDYLSSMVDAKKDLVLSPEEKKEFLYICVATEIAYRRYLKILTYDIATGAPLSLPLPMIKRDSEGSDQEWCWGSQDFEHTTPLPAGGYNQIWRDNNWDFLYERKRKP